MATDRLTVLGIRPAETSVRPAGLHLRWAFPVALGFPPGGFRVFRRPAKRADPPCIDLTLPKDRVLPTGTAAEGVTFHAHENVALRGTGQPWLAVDSVPLPGSAEPFILRLTFDGPAVSVEVRCRRPRSGAPIVLRAHDAAGGVVATASAQAPVGSRALLRLRVDAPLIDHATIRLDFAELASVCVETHARACAEPWGRPVKDLPLLPVPATPDQVEAMLAGRLGHDMRNAHAETLATARARYGPGLTEMLRWLHALVDGDPARIRNPTAPPHRREAVARRADGPLRAVHPQAMLLLTALDANIARLLSLGWADRFGGPGEEPEAGRAYDYKVVGRWRERELCGLLFDLGAAVSPRPRLDPYVDAVVLPGMRWHGAEPLRRVGVRWPRPPVPAASAPVLYRVRRARQVGGGAQGFGPPEDLTAHRPVLVPAASWTAPLGLRFVDPEVVLGSYRYSVAGIDLFGQLGSFATSLPVAVRDREAPPPPVRIAATAVQPGYPWLTPEDRALAGTGMTCAVRFEYGAFQLRQAPDAHHISLFWRGGSLTEREDVTVRVLSREPARDGRRALVVEVVSAPPGNPARFERAVLAPRPPDGSMPPAAERARFRVTAVQSLARPRLTLAPSAMDLPDGELTATIALDARGRAGWQEVPGVAVPVRPPIEGTLAVDAAAGLAFTARVRAVVPPPAPAPAPSPGEIAAPIAGFDVVIDRALLEADLFRDGEAEGPGGPMPIHSSTSGRAAVDATPEGCAGAARIRMGLDELTALQAGDLLTLPAGAAGGQPRLRLVEIALSGDVGDLGPPGGEMAFEVTREGRQVLVAARVVSDMERQGQRLRCLLRFPDGLAQSAWPRAGARLRYFPPYAIAGVSVALDMAGGGAAPLRLPIAPGEGAAMGYLTLGATDVRGNAGRLSAPVPVVAVRPPPGAAPGAPFPCGAPSAPEGFATPPDRRGRATLCLEWAPPAADATLRFEVARALGGTILATDRRHWLIGRAAPGLPSVPVMIASTSARPDGAVEVHVDSAGSAGLPDAAFADGLLWQAGVRFRLIGALTRPGGGAVRFTVAASTSGGPAAGPADLHPLPIPPRAALAAQVVQSTLDAERGLHRVEVSGLDLDGLDTRILAGGCLVQGPQRFQITRAGAEDGIVLLLRRVMGQGDPIDGDCVIETPPDYTAMAGRADKIRLLADKPGNEDAFGLVTGVPVGATDFRDEIAGTGGASFFYRVRAVDPAENRSAWSPTSVPFLPVDTTPPETPRGLRVTAGDRAATLAWSRGSAAIGGYRVFRTQGEAADDPGAAAMSPEPHALLGLGDLAPRPLTVVAGGIVLPRPLRFDLDGQLAEAEIAARLLEWIRVEPRGAPAGGNLVDPATSRAVFVWTPSGDGSLRVTVTALRGLGAVDAGTSVIVIAGAQVVDGDPTAWSWTDTGLAGGATYTYRVVATRTVRAAPLAAGGPPRELIVPSRPSAAVRVVGRDRRPVPAPLVIGAAWADASATAVRLEIRAAGDVPASLRVERRSSPESAWETATLDAGWGWVGWPSSGLDATVLATRAASSSPWEWRVAIRLGDGRVSPFSVAVGVPVGAPVAVGDQP